jgi:hypothetical protein
MWPTKKEDGEQYRLVTSARLYRKSRAALDQIRINTSSVDVHDTDETFDAQRAPCRGPLKRNREVGQTVGASSSPCRKEYSLIPPAWIVAASTMLCGTSP